MAVGSENGAVGENEVALLEFVFLSGAGVGTEVLVFESEASADKGIGLDDFKGRVRQVGLGSLFSDDRGRCDEELGSDVIADRKFELDVTRVNRKLARVVGRRCLIKSRLKEPEGFVADVVGGEPGSLASHDDFPWHLAWQPFRWASTQCAFDRWL